METADNLGQKPVLVGDPGCLVTVADRLDAKYAIGSAVGVADGMRKAGIEEKAVAIFGDSSFFHTSLPAICNAIHNRSDMLIVILDNRATAASGFQPHPGVDRDAFSQEAPALDMEQISRACGIDRIYTANAGNSGAELREVFLDALSFQGLALVIVRIDRRKEE